MADPAWDQSNLTNPHEVADKRSRVQKMFAAIAPSYDLNNRLHSFWRDQAWRRAAVKMAEVKADDVVVDVACGTGDLTLEFVRALVRCVGGRERQLGWELCGWSVPAEQIPPGLIGVDFTYEMLPIAQNKIPRFTYCGADDDGLWDGKHYPVSWINGDAQQLPLPDAYCDVVSIAFGIRNVQDIPAALREFHRVLRPGGRVIVLEFSEPTNPILRTLNRFYCGKVMPITATLISRDKSGAYKYLPKSIETFVSREKMVATLSDAGFTQIVQKPMTFGVCVCYRGVK